MATSRNDSPNGSAHHAENGTPTTFSRRTNILEDSSRRINSGGLGHAPLTATNTDFDGHKPTPPVEILRALDQQEMQYLPNYPKSLSGISLRAFLLGAVFSVSSSLTGYLLIYQLPVWRAPFFLAVLSLFHFLEFWTTAYANTSSAEVSSFLLSSNGSAYTIAHSVAFLETVFSHFFLPTAVLPVSLHYILLGFGLACIIVGQTVRTSAMITAGTNFSHLVRRRRAENHRLVTTGVYSVLRHPSYFGFFWWGVGIQLVCGNILSLVGYAVVLWKFFSARIYGEEQLLIKFFEDDYVKYRARTWVGIPGIS